MPATKTTATTDRPVRKRATTATAEKPARKRATTAERRPRQPTHAEIARHAYFIALQDGGDEVANWLRAERELQAA